MLSQVAEQGSPAGDAFLPSGPSSERAEAEVKVYDEKRGEQVQVDVADPEVAVVEEGLYSKVSVYLMMLFSGLAMGSDG